MVLKHHLEILVIDGVIVVFLAVIKGGDAFEADGLSRPVEHAVGEEIDHSFAVFVTIRFGIIGPVLAIRKRVVLIDHSGNAIPAAFPHGTVKSVSIGGLGLAQAPTVAFVVIGPQLNLRALERFAGNRVTNKPIVTALGRSGGECQIGDPDAGIAEAVFVQGKIRIGTGYQFVAALGDV